VSLESVKLVRKHACDCAANLNPSKAFGHNCRARTFLLIGVNFPPSPPVHSSPGGTFSSEGLRASIAACALRHATVAALSAAASTIIIIHLKLLAKGEIPFQTGEFHMMAGNATLRRANWFIQNQFSVLHQLNLAFNLEVLLHSPRTKSASLRSTSTGSYYFNFETRFKCYFILKIKPSYKT
jgi:hypothetical protein